MVKAVRIHETGGPEVLRFEEIALGAPGTGQARIRHRAIGLNFIDIYYRKGYYADALPHGLGMEAAGVVEALGPDVSGFAVGDRVAYATGLGAASEAANVPAAALVKLPSSITDETAAAMMLKGMTAEYLLHRTYAVKRGETIMFFAAAGGVGAIACQWASRGLGATVIGVVGSEAKEAEARAQGCAHVLVMGKDDIVARVKAITNGVGVAAVYDSIGKDTFEISLDCLKQRGILVGFGSSSGAASGITMDMLSKNGTYLTRPRLGQYIGTRAELEASAKALFDVVAAGTVKIEIRRRYALKDIALAHRDLETRKTTGASILIP